MILPPILLDLSLSDNERDLLERLFETYEHPVYNLSYSILRNRADAEDNTIQVFVNLSNVLHRIEPDIESKRNRAFIYVIAKYAALDICRKYKSEARKARLEVTESYVRDLAFDDFYYHALIHDMEQINPQATALLILKYVYGLKSKEIARMYGISVSNVDVRIHRAKKYMRTSKEIQAYKGGGGHEIP